MMRNIRPAVAGLAQAGQRSISAACRWLARHKPGSVDSAPRSSAGFFGTPRHFHSHYAAFRLPTGFPKPVIAMQLLRNLSFSGSSAAFYGCGPGFSGGPLRKIASNLVEIASNLVDIAGNLVEIAGTLK